MSNELDENYWFEFYKPIANTVEGGTKGTAGYSVNGVGYMYETYGPDYEYVMHVNGLDPRRVWTFCEEDGIGFVSSGWRFVNRMGYFVTELPYEGDYTTINMWGADELGCNDPNFCETCED